ncbi:PAPA-1-like conserved region-domain-containing protein [Mycena rebaudengoi]|nr:PAPA-1-like conserved region-domain-containing protein [Mycena rebaudengoi]
MPIASDESEVDIEVAEVDPSSEDDFDGKDEEEAARQAVLASAVDPSHVTLDSAKDGAPSKKTKFTPSEVALRKEENARKRKNMIEKKLEDEKAETIHRLLKKQSRPKNKRTAAAPQSDEDVDMDDEDTASAPGGPTTPMYRWVSTARKVADLPASDIPMPAVKSDSNSPPAMTISFSIPTSFLPGDTTDEKVTIQMPAIVESKCTVDGCGAERKYRAVGKSWGIGACGLDHLKILEGRA